MVADLSPQPTKRRLLIIFLMIDFRSEENRGRLQQARALLFIEAAFLKNFAALELLPIVLIENSRPILACFLTFVTAWSKQLHVLPNNILEGHDLRIEQNLHCLSVPSATTANIFVGRILGGSAGVAGSREFDPLDSLKRRLNTPESAGG